MTANSPASGNDRMKGYLQKIATGPKMSHDLTTEEAEDALSLILNEEASTVRAGVFLVAARMKLETLEENLGYWRALDKTTVRRSVELDRLLQIADPFDGFNRVPYFGLYAVPVLAAMGLPTYGHSAPTLPPKFGITFEDLLTQHYGIASKGNHERRIALIKEFRFGYINMQEAHPSLEKLRKLRVEIVKRTMLSTMEKMLMPVEARAGGNFLATGYFHSGYEVPMMAVARSSRFDRTLAGNGMEGTTLYGVHKPATVFVESGKNQPEKVQCQLDDMFLPETAVEIGDNYQALKSEKYDPAQLAAWGESALRNGTGPAAALVACQAGVLFHLFGFSPSFQEGYDTARNALYSGACYNTFMQYLDRCRRSG
ncbi:hypothetical protein UZ36_04765 [Candidatus Nitromaritima sp. SCGC AAA799-C22]|nr:hypothetical protein UZ36_04765 [Candidatus Nitromaritima sp. SCGC AAA799-C22]